MPKKILRTSTREPETQFLTPDIIIPKIIQHSKNLESPRLLKYLLEAKKRFSSGKLKHWTKLRSKGGIHAVENLVGRLCDGNVLQCSVVLPQNDNQGQSLREDQLNELRRNIFSSSLSILGNSYSLDYAARKEARNSGFIDVLHRIIKQGSNSLHFCISRDNDTLQYFRLNTFSCDAITKSVKCIANLAHDSNCSSTILKLGVGISIVNTLKIFIQIVSSSNISFNASESECIPVCYIECLRSCVRAVRILSSEPFCSEEGKIHLIRFGAVTTALKLLIWSSHAGTEEVTHDILRALANLTEKIRSIPTEQIYELLDEDCDSGLKSVVEVFQKCDRDSKLLSPAIKCITNFSCNVQLAEIFGKLKIFPITLKKLQNISEKATIDLCRLLTVLTKHSSVNQCLLNNCQEIYLTLYILQSPGLQRYHRWLLQVYEKVYEGSLKSLLRHGLIELLHVLLKQELGDCSYDLLRMKISTLCDTICPIHNDSCMLQPAYRCDSPSYHQVQEEIKALCVDRLQSRVDSGIESSPSSSPARSWTSGSEESVFEARSSTPTSSDDEGCYSPVDMDLSYSPIYESGCEQEIGNGSLTEQPRKRIRLDPCESTYTSDKHIPWSIRTENIKNKSKRIVSILNILHKTTHLSPKPLNLIDLVPILLSVILRGIVSLLPQKQLYDYFEKDQESINLGRQAFSLAYRILQTMFQDTSLFTDFVKCGTIAVTYSLCQWDDILISTGNEQTISKLINTLAGKSNTTTGFREGRLLRTLLVSDNSTEINNTAIAIPLLFRENNHTLRNFEMKGKCWNRVFELLCDGNDLDSLVFQDCILSLCSLSQTLGMSYDSDYVKHRPQLQKLLDLTLVDVLKTSSEPENFNSFKDEGFVEIILDDKTSMYVSKNMLTDSSPVFSAMFDGHFKEAGSQRVYVSEVSRTAIVALVEQLHIERSFIDNVYIDLDDYSLSTLFELAAISDRFLLESIYEKTLNSILCNYMCPASVPKIYHDAVKLSRMSKPGTRSHSGDLDLSYTVLKYALASDVSFSLKCTMFRKIFEAVDALIVVGDIRALVDFYALRPKHV